MKLPVIPCAATVLLACAAGLASAQPVYRIVGPDGRVTFSDKPPVVAPATAAGTPAQATSAGVAPSALPFELRGIADRYPVTLYTSADCAPCSTARSLLRSRGVPYVEKTVATNDDADALKRISGDTSLPFATVGAQHLQGFSDAEWTQYLDAAGYPKQSQLPAGYQPPPATPLVAAKRIEAPAAGRSAPAGGASPAARPAPRPPVNPAGIQF